MRKKFSDFFKFDWKAQIWNLVVVLGAIIGGYIAYNFMIIDYSIDLNPKTIAHLKLLGIENAGSTYMPDELFGLEAIRLKNDLFFYCLVVCLLALEQDMQEDVLQGMLSQDLVIYNYHL